MEPRIAIPGSQASQTGDESWVPAEADQQISPTIVIRRPPGAGDLSQRLLSGSWRQMSRAETEKFLRAEPADLAAVRAFAQRYELSVIAENADARTVQVKGSTLQAGKAFGADIGWRLEPDGQRYLSYRGALTVPVELAGIVKAVLGLDQRPVAKRDAAHS